MLGTCNHATSLCFAHRGMLQIQSKDEFYNYTRSVPIITPNPEVSNPAFPALIETGSTDDDSSNPARPPKIPSFSTYYPIYPNIPFPVL